MLGTQLRLSRRPLALAAGLVLVTALAPAPAAAETAPSGLSGPATGAVKVVPLSADLLITRTTVNADGHRKTTQEINHLYRDSRGRTYTDTGSSVTISDPVAQTTITLDTGARTFRRVSSDRSGRNASAAPRAGDTLTGNQQLASQPRSLGEAVIAGVRAEGRSYSVTVPARKGLPGRQYAVTLWASTDVQLPVRTRVVEDSGQVFEQTYTNIRAGKEPAAALFQIPAGYREAGPAAAPRQTGANRAAQATCPIDYIDPVILVSFSGFPVGISVPAVTDAGAGCIFVADAAVWEFPLWLQPATPLFLPVDIWDALYFGHLPPFLPYTAFGDVAFAAASTGDATVVDSLVILQLF